MVWACVIQPPRMTLRATKSVGLMVITMVIVTFLSIATPFSPCLLARDVEVAASRLVIYNLPLRGSKIASNPKVARVLCGTGVMYTHL